MTYTVCLTNFKTNRPEVPKKFLLDKSLEVVMGPVY